MKLRITRAVVTRRGQRARELIFAAGWLLAEPSRGYAARILGGRVLAGSELRLKPARYTWSACLPGQFAGDSQAGHRPDYRPRLGGECPHSGTCPARSGPDCPGKLRIADRNFCVRTFLFGIARSEGCFLVRQHLSTLPFEPVGPLVSVGRCTTGEAFEQEILVEDPNLPGVRQRLQRIVVQLDKPSRDGEVEIALVTNLPANVMAIDCWRPRRSIDAGRSPPTMRYGIPPAARSGAHDECPRPTRHDGRPADRPWQP